MISGNEFIDFLKLIGEDRTNSEAYSMMKAADMDCDGEISLEDYLF